MSKTFFFVIFLIIIASKACGVDEDCENDNPCHLAFCETSTSTCFYEFAEENSFCDEGVVCIENSKCDAKGECILGENVCINDLPCFVTSCSGGDCNLNHKCEDNNPCTDNVCVHGTCTHTIHCKDSTICIYGSCIDVLCSNNKICNPNEDLCDEYICDELECKNVPKLCPKQECFEGECSPSTGKCVDYILDLSYCRINCTSSTCYWKKEENHKRCLKLTNSSLSKTICGKDETIMFNNEKMDERTFLEHNYLSYLNNVYCKDNIFNNEQHNIAFESLELLSKDCKINNLEEFVILGIQLHNIIVGSMCCCERELRSCNLEEKIDTYHKDIDILLEKHNFLFDNKTKTYLKNKSGKKDNNSNIVLIYFIFIFVIICIISSTVYAVTLYKNRRITGVEYEN